MKWNLGTGEEKHDVILHYSVGLGPYWYQILNKFYEIPKNSKFYVEKGYLC